MTVRTINKPRKGADKERVTGNFQLIVFPGIDPKNLGGVSFGVVNIDGAEKYAVLAESIIEDEGLPGEGNLVFHVTLLEPPEALIAALLAMTDQNKASEEDKPAAWIIESKSYSTSEDPKNKRRQYQVDNMTALIQPVLTSLYDTLIEADGDNMLRQATIITIDSQKIQHENAKFDGEGKKTGSVIAKSANPAV